VFVLLLHTLISKLVSAAAASAPLCAWSRPLV
jgi:hypothetical protein